MNKDVKKILIVVALYGLANGLFYNFQQLWLLDNGMSVKSISIIITLSSLIAVPTIFVCSNFIHQNKVKHFYLFYF